MFQLKEAEELSENKITASHWRNGILSSAALAAEAGPPNRRQSLRRRRRVRCCIRRQLAVLPVTPSRGPRQEAAFPGHRQLVFQVGLQHVGDGHAGFPLRLWHLHRHWRIRPGAVFSDLNDAIGLPGPPWTLILRRPLIVAARHGLCSRLFARLPRGSRGVIAYRQDELVVSPVLTWLPWRSRRTALQLADGDVAAAERAAGVRLEPRVDAGQVEGVAALGEQAEALAVPELAEAHGAVRAVNHEPVAALVLAHGDLVDQRLVHPVRRRQVPRILLASGGIGAVAAARAGAGAGAEEPGPEGAEGAAVLGDDGVVADEEEGAGEHPDDGDDEGREGGAGGVVVAAGPGDVEGRRRGREDEVAPLRAVHAAQALRAIPRWLVGHPRWLRHQSYWRRVDHCSHGRY